MAGTLQSCGGSGFREVEVAIDGQPAGVAPVFPWIFTGGIDPYLWMPIPGVHSLSFAPHRVDLTPFAALLSDGRAHEVAVGVYNANKNFAATRDAAPVSRSRRGTRHRRADPEHAGRGAGAGYQGGC